MNANTQSVIFGKAPVKTRASFHGIISKYFQEDESDRQTSSDSKGALTTSEGKGSMKISNDDRMRLVQLEIAQKEACKVLKSICEEISRLYQISIGSDPEISDFLTGILILGNLCKRIGKEKLEKDRRIESLHEEIEKMKESHYEVSSHLEASISNLQQEHVRLNDIIHESTLKHGHKVNLMSKELFILQESVDKLNLEKEKLETKLQQAERRLMEVPRLEEAVLRNAKSMIRQQEITNTKSKIETKKNEEEIKNLSFWKNKAKALEEENQKLLTENRKVGAQARILHNKYMSILTHLERVKNNSSGLNKTKPVTLQVRPSSAPPVKQPLSEAQSRILSVNPEEIVKLQRENKRKTRQVISLAQKLSVARAYPLKTVEESNYDADILVQPDNEASNPSNFPLFNKLQSTNRVDDLESVSSQFLREEDLLQERRIMDALQLQSELRLEHQKKLNSLPKHINAIRKSKKFGKYLKDIEIEGD